MGRARVFHSSGLWLRAQTRPGFCSRTAVWPFLVVLPLPMVTFPRASNRSASAHPQALFAQSAVKALRMRVLCWLARLDVAQIDLPLRAQARKSRLVSSGPLSQRIATGRPRMAMISSSTRVTRRLANPVSTSSAETLPCKGIHYTQHADGASGCNHIGAKSSAHSWLTSVSAGAASPHARSACASSASGTAPPRDSAPPRL